MTGVRFSSLVPGDAVVIKADITPGGALQQEKSHVYLLTPKSITGLNLKHLFDTVLVCNVISLFNDQIMIGSSYDTSKLIPCPGPWLVAVVMNRKTVLDLHPASPDIKNGSLILVREDDDLASMFATVKEVLR